MKLDQITTNLNAFYIQYCLLYDTLYSLGWYYNPKRVFVLLFVCVFVHEQSVHPQLYIKGEGSAGKLQHQEQE